MLHFKGKTVINYAIVTFAPKYYLLKINILFVCVCNKLNETISSPDLQLQLLYVLGIDKNRAGDLSPLKKPFLRSA